MLIANCQEILLAISLLNEPETDFYQEFEGIPQKRGSLADETGGTLQYIPQLYRRNRDRAEIPLYGND